MRRGNKTDLWGSKGSFIEAVDTQAKVTLAGQQPCLLFLVAGGSSPWFHTLTSMPSLYPPLYG